MLGITYRDEQTCAKRFEPRITPNIRLCWLCGWFGCLRADRPVMAG
jgi:hypothetical protein